MSVYVRREDGREQVNDMATVDLSSILTLVYQLIPIIFILAVVGYVKKFRM